MTSSTWAVHNKEIVPFSSVTLSPESGIVQYGLGCFEGVRGYPQEQGGTALFRLDDHLRRLARSCAVLHIQLPGGSDELRELILDMLRREAIDGPSYVKVLAYKGHSEVGGTLARMPDGFLAYAWPLATTMGAHAQMEMSVSPWRRISDNAIPARAKITGAYVNSVLARSQAQALGRADAILLTMDGHVAEASGANLFVCRGSQLVTPPVSDDILEGISRATVIELARELGLETIERSVDVSELYTADEVFVCGTGVEMRSLVRVDDYPVGAGVAGAVFSDLDDAFHDVVTGVGTQHKDWLTAI